MSVQVDNVAGLMPRLQRMADEKIQLSAARRVAASEVRSSQALLKQAKDSLADTQEETQQAIQKIAALRQDLASSSAVSRNDLLPMPGCHWICVVDPEARETGWLDVRISQS